MGVLFIVEKKIHVWVPKNIVKTGDAKVSMYVVLKIKKKNFAMNVIFFLVVDLKNSQKHGRSMDRI